MLASDLLSRSMDGNADTYFIGNHQVGGAGQAHAFGFSETGGAHPGIVFVFAVAGPPSVFTSCSERTVPRSRETSCPVRE